MWLYLEQEFLTRRFQGFIQATPVIWEVEQDKTNLYLQMCKKWNLTKLFSTALWCKKSFAVGGMTSEQNLGQPFVNSTINWGSTLSKEANQNFCH